MKKKTIVRLLTLVMMATLFSGCHKSGEEESILGEQVSVEKNSMQNEATETSEVLAETEPVIQKQGGYTLENCVNSFGFFIAHEDGSFSRYLHGGCCPKIDNNVRGFEGMFMEDIDAENIPILTSKDTLALFWDSNYSVSVLPVHAEEAAIQVTAEDGMEGFARLSESSIFIYYRSNDYAHVTLQTINGESPDKYEPEEVCFTVNPHKGMPSETASYKIRGFKRDATVSLGIAEGTTLVETTYDIDCTYYNCNRSMNNWEEEDIYYPSTRATTQGYAVLDFTEIPSGRYVMIVEGNGKYIATLLNWQNG